MSVTVIDTVKCEAWGCGVRIRRDAGSVFCVKNEAEYEQVAYNLEARPLAKLLEARRVPVEVLTAPVAANPSRRSALLAKLPRVNSGVGAMHADEVCEASDFPTLLAHTSWREKALLGAGVLVTAGVAGLAMTLLGLGAKVALGWLLGRSA